MCQRRVTRRCKASRRGPGIDPRRSAAVCRGNGIGGNGIGGGRRLYGSWNINWSGWEPPNPHQENLLTYIRLIDAEIRCFARGAFLSLRPSFSWLYYQFFSFVFVREKYDETQVIHSDETIHFFYIFGLNAIRICLTLESAPISQTNGSGQENESVTECWPAPVFLRQIHRVELIDVSSVGSWLRRRGRYSAMKRAFQLARRFYWRRRDSQVLAVAIQSEWRQEMSPDDVAGCAGCWYRLTDLVSVVSFDDWWRLLSCRGWRDNVLCGPRQHRSMTRPFLRQSFILHFTRQFRVEIRRRVSFRFRPWSRRSTYPTLSPPSFFPPKQINNSKKKKRSNEINSPSSRGCFYWHEARTHENWFHPMSWRHINWYWPGRIAGLNINEGQQNK